MPMIDGYKIIGFTKGAWNNPESAAHADTSGTRGMLWPHGQAHDEGQPRSCTPAAHRAQQSSTWSR